ncbi:MAG TPA: spore germination protein [Oscillospiraceae bacterium]|nr:spore germination protein [Oscillospiraceae bacterium]
MANAFTFLKKLVARKEKPKPPMTNNKQAARKPENDDTPVLSERLALIKKRLGESNDVVIREFNTSKDQVKLALLLIDGLVDKKMINDNIMLPILSNTLANEYSEKLTASNAFELLNKHITAVSELSQASNLTQALKMVLSGDTALFIDGEQRIIVFGTRMWEKRTVAEPVTEAAVRGPREGFTETMRINTSLLRRRIKHENLRFETMKAGRRTATDINLVYINDIVNQETLAEVRQRIAAIDTDAILESGYIEEYIEDAPFSIFPQLEHTERVDKAAAAILEGRVLVMTDNTPFMLIVPTSFFQFIQASEDFYERPYVALFLRLLRLFVLNIALILPATYVAVISFHQEMLPTSLLLNITAAREGIPFPAVAEALLMEGTFEVLREAGIRLPKTVGQAVSIVGGLVIGDAAIRAGLVSPGMVIIVAATAISTFAIPAFNASVALRLLRFPLIILGAMMGLYGVIFGLIIILIHLAGLQSFGVPYLTPLVHGTFRDMVKTIVRPPWWANIFRPRLLDPQQRRRQATNTWARHTPLEERELTHEESKDRQPGKG